MSQIIREPSSGLTLLGQPMLERVDLSTTQYDRVRCAEAKHFSYANILAFCD